jgi:rubredoxin
MARISIDEIKNSLSTDGWSLISETYKNLDSNLEYKCNKGHTVIAPWKKIRDNRICPTCMRERLKTKEFKNTKKKKGEYRILALD